MSRVDPVAAGALEPVTIETATGLLTYFRTGSMGPPIVVLNALGQGLEPWSRLVERLAPRRIVVWPMRGAGAGQALLLGAQLDDLASIRARESAEPCHIVGWCTGAKLALWHCLANATGVRSMVFLNGAFKHPAREPELDTSYERDLESICRAVDRRPEAAARLMRILGADNDAGGRGSLPPEALAASARRPFASATAFLVYARQHLDFWSSDPLPAAAGLTVPMLFVGGELDVIVCSEGVRRAAAGLPAARYTEIPGATHYALFERADDVGTVIERFVRQHEL